MLHLVIGEGSGNASLQFLFGDAVLQMKNNSSAALEPKHIVIHHFKGGYQFAGALEVHGILIRIFWFPIYSDGTAIFSYITGLAPFKGFFKQAEAFNILGGFNDQGSQDF